MVAEKQRVFIAGATGYMGQRLAAELARRGHAVSGRVPAGSEGKLSTGCAPVIGNALDAATFRDKIGATSTLCS